VHYDVKTAQMIKDVILGQKNELELRLSEKYVYRIVPDQNFDDKLIRVIIGPRRAGKSFFGMRQLAKGRTFGFVNFDDERLVRVKNFDEILGAVNSVYNNPELILLDEIQNLKDWELIVNRLHRQGQKLIVTGSNSNLLSKELSTHLTGRHLPIYINTFSFAEYLAFFEAEQTEAEKINKFQDYLTNGGYPEPLVKSIDYTGYLRVLFDSILFKDIVKRYKIRQAEMLEDLAVWFVSNITSEFSMTSITRQVNISSVHTVKKYLSYLEEVFMFFTVPAFSFKTGNILKSNKKIYCYDNGFFRAKANFNSNDWGKLLENLVASHLVNLQSRIPIDVFYWIGVNQVEVDFVIKRGKDIDYLIQVCWDTSNPKTRKREVRGLLHAWQKLKSGKLMVLTSNEESCDVYKWNGVEKEIQFLPAWKWLLKFEIQ
jgi:predicted AAA+ superfamily ATPase